MGVKIETTEDIVIIVTRTIAIIIIVAMGSEISAGGLRGLG